MRFFQRLGKGACTFGCGLLLLVFGLEVFNRFRCAQVQANKSTCLENTVGISRSLLMYSHDWDDALPLASHWATSAGKYISPKERIKTFHCPEVRAGYGYVFNIRLDGMKMIRLKEPSATPLIYEGDAAISNTAGDGKIPPIANRHTGGTNVGYADGHARWANTYMHVKIDWQLKVEPQTSWKKK